MRDAPRICFYDLESKPLQGWIWRCGDQYVGHKQLVKGYDQYGIICITYCFNDGEPAKCIDWGYEEQDTAKVVAEFDEIVKTCDHFIGKNSDRFDIKMINAARMLSGLPGMPQWMLSKDDLEKQMRKYFGQGLPSMSLDYISGKLGLGGKIKMEFQDWIDICEKNDNGKAAFEKMCEYGMKDVEDTRTIWYKLQEHFEPKFNYTGWNGELSCQHCGSTHLIGKGKQFKGKKFWKRYGCGSCHTSYACLGPL